MTTMAITEVTRALGKRARAPESAAPGGLRSEEISRLAVRLVVVQSGEGPTRRATDGGAEVHAEGAAPRLVPFATLPQLLRADDLVVVNDAATLPASLPGETARGERFELRLAGPIEPHHLAGVVMGAGDYLIRTEHRGAPPKLVAGDRVRIAGRLGFDAIVTGSSGRLVELATRIPEAALWEAIYRGGAPIQYAHRREPLALWSVQTAYATRPWAVEMPSAGRALTWDILLGLRQAGIALATLTHAAGLSATGDDALDRALPWPERFEIPRRTARLVAETRARGGRVIAVGTTVVRALEAALDPDTRAVRPGGGVATLRLGPGSRLQIVDGVISGLHAPGESHFELLSAFAPRERLERALSFAAEHRLSSHELGDACLILR